ncbi:aldose 1-epimerase-like [Chelonus insularis]|uniref:aldose 1-epimerase-like n=1 Tax=Chelonus insularis TaxID=460826 RepID=UPI0015887802|nr:aldose 1-epimerase-like [Chelonus insularis]XP_034945501.1 aldose 1-epimerase-like [Chelonus insularis]
MNQTIITENGFGLIGSEIVRRYTLINKNQASVTLITWGAGIQSIKIPNKRGAIGDVILGWDDLQGYLDNRYIGRTIGRVTNRIFNGAVSIGDKQLSLSKNYENKHHLNGGFLAFDNVNWDSHVLDKQVVMSHLSRNGSEGYPGDMLIQVKYTWTDDNELQIVIRATCTQPTPVDISNCYFLNLAGHGTGPEELEKHTVTINADKLADIEYKEMIPTGKIYPVADTVFDLRIPKQMTKQVLRKACGGGFNHNFCVNCPSVCSYRFHARVSHAESGRYVEYYSNQPSLHFSTGNHFPARNLITGDTDESGEEKNNGLYGKGGILYQKHGAFAISPQNYPNSISHNHFPSSILFPGQVYYHEIALKFGIINENQF